MMMAFIKDDRDFRDKLKKEEKSKKLKGIKPQIFYRI